jgi:hypothetical protein
LIAALSDPDAHARHAGNIAHELADVNPAEAERALGLIKSDNRITPYPVRVCYRMAKVDLPRARRIADAADRNTSRQTNASTAHAYGVMAMALMEKDPSMAKQLVADAFARLTPANPRTDDPYAFSVGVALLGFAETVDPDRMHDYFWRTLALHRGPEVESWSPIGRNRSGDGNTANLVALLGAFQQCPQLQRELMEPVFKYWDGFTSRKEFEFYGQNAVFTAMALTDPDRTIRWHSGFWAKLAPEELRSTSHPWLSIANAFSNDGPDLQKLIAGRVFHLWVIDKEDL